MDQKSSDLYRITCNETGRTYMDCDRETALRLIKDLNSRYEGTYSYKAEKIN